MKWYKRLGVNDICKSKLKNNHIYYLWGNPYRLRILEGNHIDIKNNYMNFYTNSNNTLEQNRRILYSWYEDILYNKILENKDRIENIVGEKANEYLIKHRRNAIWGSCDVEGKRIRIDFRVVFFRPEILEYILIHELIHIRILDHNEKFFKEEKKYSPNAEICSYCLTFKNPDYRYYDYVSYVMDNFVKYCTYASPFRDDFKNYIETYCNEHNIEKEVL